MPAVAVPLRPPAVLTPSALEPPVVLGVIPPTPAIAPTCPDIPPEIPTGPPAVPPKPALARLVFEFEESALQPSQKAMKVNAAFDTRVDRVRLALHVAFPSMCFTWAYWVTRVM